MRIGILADMAGTTVPTIRYYEQIGLLRPAVRQGGGQRTYDREDVRRVRRCRAFGFAIDEVRTLLALTGDRSALCSDARDLAERHLGMVRSKLAELRALETSIASLVSNCNSTSAGGAAPIAVYSLTSIRDEIVRPAP
jgi:DNA-binding transcriptional MerR regulator